MMPYCNSDPDKLFHSFKVLEFPASFVGLATTLELDLEADITGPCYVRTSFQNSLMTFDEASDLSPAHRAFTITQVDKQMLKIVFKPTNECISKAIKMQKPLDKIDNRFVADLRAIRADGFRCCNNVHHAEIGRYYICGIYTYCNIHHSPNNVNFDVVPLKARAVRTVRIRNESKLAAKITYIKVAGFDVTPRSFIISANSSKKVEIILNPNSHSVPSSLVFNVRNAYDPYTEPLNSGVPITDTNFLPYTMIVHSKVKFGLVGKTPVVKSLQSIWEPNPNLTYLNEELIKHNKQKDHEAELLKFAKSSSKKKAEAEKRVIQLECYPEPPKPVDPRTTGRFFCKYRRPRINAWDLFDVVMTPNCLDFGKVGVNTYGKEKLLIRNRTKYEIDIKFMENNFIVYTNSKHSTYSIKLRAMAETIITILCHGSYIHSQIHEAHESHKTKHTFSYLIDNKFCREQLFRLEIGNPVIFVTDSVLKFGMITSECFITHVSVKIFNDFNVPINFEWQELPEDVPFDIVPSKGTVASHGVKICDFRYIPRINKAKMYETILISKGTYRTMIEFEVHIITRKLSVKFVQTQVQFRDVPLNIKVIEDTRLENNSREIAVFRVMEPLLPGVTVAPMEGILKPKAVVTFIITVKIACVLEFNFDLCVRLNNKENVVILVHGKVVEPKLFIHPRNMIMPRLPCGMITFIPVKFQNVGSAKSVIEILHTDDENIFKVYIQSGNEKEIISMFTLEPGQSITLFVKVYDVFRREYDQFLPLRINNILGPPNEEPGSTELNYFTLENAQIYDNNPKAKAKNLNKDIPYFRISGVFTTPWVVFSLEYYEIRYIVCEINKITFTMENVSKYTFNVTINISKLYPHFSMEVSSQSIEPHGIISTDNVVKFELEPEISVTITVYFHPQRQGKFVAVAPLYLDPSLSTAYSNLTFIGSREHPEMKASVFRLAFPPCLIGKELSQTFFIDLEEESDIDMFRCSSKEEPCVKVEFTNIEVVETENVMHTLVTVRVTVHSDHPHTRTMCILFNHDFGSTCSVEINFCFTYCAVTLHSNIFVQPEDNPYPYYPLETHTTLYNYMERCMAVMESWMYYIGFRRELFPTIPDTFHSISFSMVGKEGGGRKTKFKSMSMVNFFKRIAGPLMKNPPKATYPAAMDETLRTVKEIHDIYENMIRLLRSRGAHVPLIKAKYLLTFEQFLLYINSERAKYVSEDALYRFLKDNEDMYNRLTKQCWFDFLLQSYKVFIVDSCLFNCVCVSNENRDIVTILVNWYNEQINITNQCFSRTKTNLKPFKHITNITTDLMNGHAIICTMYNHCSFLKDHLSMFSDVDENEQTCIVNNACLIIEALNTLKVYFPLRSTDFLDPNFLHMLILSVHLYVLLPMFRQRSVVNFNPPLLRTSIRALTISPSTQETLTFNFVILNNKRNSFFVEKTTGDNGKKLYLNVKYFAKFVSDDQALLLVHGYNKTRIFDTFMTFDLVGKIGALPPMRKCKISAPLYRPIKVDISVHSPFDETVAYSLCIMENEPIIPVTFEDPPTKGFYVKRLKLMDNQITLTKLSTDVGADAVEHKVYFQMYCLSCQTVQLYLWFRSEIGEFFIKLTSQPRWDIPVDTQQVTVYNWPIDPCSCGEDCECYRTTVVNIPHCNELMLKSLRFAMLDFATPLMIEIFDKLIGTETGQIIAMMLLTEGGTNPSEVAHILRPETTYHIFSRNVMPRLDRATLNLHSDGVLALPITIPPNESAGKFTVTLTSQCNMDIRNYRFLIVVVEDEKSSNDSHNLFLPIR